MKNKFLLFLILFHTVTAMCQELPDSLLMKYNNAKQPFEKGNILLNNLNQVKGTPSDKLKMLLKQLAYFTDNDDTIGIGYTQLNIGYLVASTGDLSVSLKYGVSALHKFEKMKDTSSLLSSYILIANSLTASKNFRQGLKYLQQGQPIAKRFRKDPYYYSAILNNTADAFIQMKMPDSALPYIQEAVRIDYEAKDSYSLASSICTLGETYLSKKEYDIGRPFMRKSIGFATEVNDRETLAYVMGALADSYHETAEIDSSIVYAYRSLHYSKPDYKPITLKSYELLYRNFEKLHRQDSAYKYLRLTMGIKDSLFTEEKSRNIQTLNFNEQLRQQEMAVQMQQIETQRAQNIQYAFVAIGVVTLLVLFLILSHSIITNSKMIKFFSITGLLLVFEFLNLIFHPFLDRITNHSPFPMLLCMVGMAFLLVPAHHRIEKWATEKLIEKNKKIRLAAARKTLRMLEEQSPVEAAGMSEK